MIRRKNLRAVWLNILTVCTILLVHLPFAMAETATPKEVTAAYLYHFPKFIEWPADAEFTQQQSFDIAILGNTGVADAMAVLSGRNIKHTSLAVRPCEHIACTDSAAVVFVGRTEQQHVAQLLHRLQGKPVLTVSDIHGFVAHGGMIEVVFSHGRATFIVNHEAMRQAHLQARAQLLELAIQVIGR